MSATGLTGMVTNLGEENPYIRAYRREINGTRSTNMTERIRIAQEVKSLHVRRPHELSRERRLKHERLTRHASTKALQRRDALTAGREAYITQHLPTVGNLMDYSQRNSPKNLPAPRAMDLATIIVNQQAKASVVSEYSRSVEGGTYGSIPKGKQNDSIRLMYENFSSLSLFADGLSKHKKIRHLNKLISEYGVDVMAGCETRTDWRFVTNEEDRFCNLFGNGQLARGSRAFNSNENKTRRDQWGGTCITAVGRAATFVSTTGEDETGLGRWAWLYMSGGGKATRVIVAYQPCQPKRRNTMGETVWDQHVRYHESQGEVRNPRIMFRHDLVELLLQWKRGGDEIILAGDFNENVYHGPLSVLLEADDLRMREICHKVTGVPLPATHLRGRIPIDGVFCTAGADCTSATLLPPRAGVGDHRVFLLDFASETIIGDIFPRVVPIFRRQLNCSSDRIKQNYIQVLSQLATRHKILRKMEIIDEDQSATPAMTQLRMSKVDLELEQFMKSAERDCHKYKRDNLEWSPLASVWIHRRWLLKRVQTYMSGNTRDPRNLFRECRKRGVKDLSQLKSTLRQFRF
jgi:hypothetical protein